MPNYFIRTKMFVKMLKNVLQTYYNTLCGFQIQARTKNIKKKYKDRNDSFFDIEQLREGIYGNEMLLF